MPSKFIPSVPHRNNLLRLILSLFLFTLPIGCAGRNADDLAENSIDQGTSPAVQSPAEINILQPEKLTPQTTALTYLNADGNRYLPASGGDILKFISIPLESKPVWIISAPLHGSSYWFVALDNGYILEFELSKDGTIQQLLPDLKLPAAMPPIAAVANDQISLITPPIDASPVTHPIVVSDRLIVYINADGEMVLDQNGIKQAINANPLPDARILSNGDSKLLFLSDPTDLYPHGVLGDEIEARSISIIDLSTSPISKAKIMVGNDDVIEGIAPIWEDLDGDGFREIIVTQSNPQVGSRIVVYSQNGNLIAQSEPIGTGNRWMHQIAAAQFIPGGAKEIALVRTPHIGGIVEIYSIEGNILAKKASLNGFSSHQIGSRNLDSALAADFNGDGQVELIVPDQKRQFLSGLQHNVDHLEIIWQINLSSALSTNLSAISLENKQMILAAGTEKNELFFWLTD